MPNLAHLAQGPVLFKHDKAKAVGLMAQSDTFPSQRGIGVGKELKRGKGAFDRCLHETRLHQRRQALAAQPVAPG